MEYGKKAQYERWIKPAQPSTLYPFAYNFILVNSIEQLRDILSQNFNVVAFDTETTGLNLDEAKLVGYSFCFNGKDAYYVPVDHAEYETDIIVNKIEISQEEYLKNKEDTRYYITENNTYYSLEYQKVKPGLGPEAVYMFYDKMVSCNIVLMFNARFDMRVFEKYGFVQNNVPYDERYKKLNNGLDMSRVKFMDVQVLAFLADTNVPYPSLKKSEDYFLGWRGASFEDTLGDAENFYYLKPEESVVYAATDALGTFLLGEVLSQFYKEANEDSKGPYGSGYLDNTFLYPLMMMEEELVNVDLDLLHSYSEYYTKEINRVEQESFAINNNEAFNMGSPKQKSEVLKKLGIDTGEVNKRGELKADKLHLQKALENYSPEDCQYKMMKNILDYATLNKQKGTYVDNFIEMCNPAKNPYGNRLRFSYKTMVVPSGRLAAGGDKKNSYFADSNIQNITKPKIAEVFYIHKDSLKDLNDGPIDISCYDNPRQEYIHNGEKTYMILDWVFKETPWNITYTPENPNHFMIEGFKQKLNIRSAFCPDDDKYWVSCDFSAQELRLPALLSKEPLWSKTFENGGDLHKEMAIQMWGLENYDKQKRKMAKKANFGILYGMTARNFAEDFKISMDEAEDLIRKYKSSAPVLFEWVHNNEQKIIETGVGKTFCGRPRRLGWYLRQRDRGLYNFGIRSCTNTVIQGSGADILKISFLNIYKMFFENPETREINRNYIKFLNTVHDEINYNVSKKHIRALVPKIISCMRLWLDDWSFPMQVGLDIGTRWGQTIAFDYDGAPYIKLTEENMSEYANEPRYRKLTDTEAIKAKVVGLKKYVQDPNGEFVKNKNYLNIIGPAGEPYDPTPKETQDIKQVETEVEDDTDDLSYISEFEEFIDAELGGE